MSHIGEKCDRLTQFFSTCEENKTLAKEDRVKMSPFYVKGDKISKGNPGHGGVLYFEKAHSRKSFFKWLMSKHWRSVDPDPFVLRTTPLKSPAPTTR